MGHKERKSTLWAPEPKKDSAEGREGLICHQGSTRWEKKIATEAPIFSCDAHVEMDISRYF
jgi:hypothetical protein